MCQVCISASLLVSVLSEHGSNTLSLWFFLVLDCSWCLLTVLIYISFNKGCSRTPWESLESVTERVLESTGIFLLYFWKHQLTWLSCDIQTVSVCRTTTPSACMRIISPREFVDVVVMKQYEDGTMLSAATNVEHPLCPPQPNFVRGFNYPCGCFCIPVPGEPDRTELLTFFQTDLGGYLPQTVVDSFFPSSISGFYSNLTKAVKALKAWQDELLGSPAEGRKQPVSLWAKIPSWPQGFSIS